MVFGLTDWASQKAAVDSGIKASNDWWQTKEAAAPAHAELTHSVKQTRRAAHFFLAMFF